MIIDRTLLRLGVLMRSTLRPAVALTVVSAFLAGSAAAQSPKEIFDNMLAEYERRIANVDNYTVVQEMMGVEAVMYYEKEIENGRPLMRLRQNRVAGMTSDSDDEDTFAEMYKMVPELVAHATYAGRDEVDGHAVHVIEVEDLDQIDFGQEMGDEDFTPQHGTFFIDTELWIPRRMMFAGEAETADGPRTVTSTIDLLDYREIDGMLHPFATSITVEGIGAVVDPEMRAQYEEMKKQLAELPEAQRAMAERMMKGQMEQIEQMMEGGDDTMTVQTTVRELHVNQGPPN
jgi:hypothetical protein